MEVKLKTKHIIMLSKLVSKMELEFDIKGKDQEELGVEIVFEIISNIHKADKELYDLLGSITGYTSERIADTDLKELADELKAIIGEVANFLKPTV
jgi:hypothetical protein